MLERVVLNKKIKIIDFFCHKPKWKGCSDLEKPESKKTILNADGADLWTSSDVPVDLVQSAALAVQEQLCVYTIKMFGKKVDQPRRVGFYGPAVGYDILHTYFHQQTFQRRWWPFWPNRTISSTRRLWGWRSCQSLRLWKGLHSFHSDDEKGLHGNFVATVSTGADRFFVVKKKETKETVAKLSTEAHPMIVMEGAQFQRVHPWRTKEQPRTSFIRWHKV